MLKSKYTILYIKFTIISIDAFQKTGYTMRNHAGMTLREPIIPLANVRLPLRARTTRHTTAPWACDPGLTVRSAAMPQLAANTHQRREVFARYGLVMHCAQRIDQSLSNLVASVSHQETLPSDCATQAPMSDDIFLQTIARLLACLRNHIDLPQGINHALVQARHKRNWLARKYFWTREDKLTTAHGRTQLIDELDELGEWFARIETHLQSIEKQWAAVAGDEIKRCFSGGLTHEP